MEVAKWNRDKQKRYALVGVKYPCKHVDLTGAPVCRKCKAEENIGRSPLAEIEFLRKHQLV